MSRDIATPTLDSGASSQSRPRRPIVDSVMADQLTIYHDGSCPLCRLEISHYRRQAGSEHLCFVDVADASADVGSDLDRAAAMKRFHVRLPDGRLLSGARAFTAIWRHLPRWRWAARAADLPGAPAILELAYRLFLPARPVLARLARVFGI